MATHSVTNVLGGELILGKPLSKSGALAELVREGLPVKSLLLLAERLDIRQAEISEKIGIPKRTLTRRLTQHSRLTAAESDRAVRLAQVFSNAAEILGDGDKAAAWLKTPEPGPPWRPSPRSVRHRSRRSRSRRRPGPYRLRRL